MVDHQAGVAMTIEQYDYFVPTDLPVLEGWLHIASDLLSTYDDAAALWRERAKENPGLKSSADGLLVGLCDRARDALRSVQILTMHRQFKDSVSVARTVTECVIYGAYVWQDPGAAEQRALAYERFQVIHRLRVIRNVQALGLGAELLPETVKSVEDEYSRIESEFPGRDLWHKAPFAKADGGPASFGSLAREGGVEDLYRTAFDHGSAFIHVTPASLMRSPFGGPTLGIIAGVLAFQKLLHLADRVLALRIRALLEILDTRRKVLAVE
jgi:hypothetical protein